MPLLRSGSSVAYSGTTWQELVESSTGRTLYDLDWAFEADHDDTDIEQDPGAADPGDDKRDVANPAVADPKPQMQPGSGSSCSGSSNVIMKQRKVILKPASQKLYAQRGEMQVFHMTDSQLFDDIHTYGTTAELRSTRYHADWIPCRHCMRDVHMATYVLGAKADPNDLVHALRKTGMPIIVLVFTEVVSDHHGIYKVLQALCDDCASIRR